MKSFYCVLYDDDRKLFDVYGPISDDTLFTNSVVDGQRRGMHIHCGTVMASDVSSIEDLKRDGDPPGFRYHAGLIKELEIQV